MRGGKSMGVGLQVLTKTACSLIFYLQHQWRCCQTIACLGPCTPGTISLEESWKLWFIHQYFFPHAKVYLISSSLCCVCLGFFFFFHSGPTNASWAGQCISQATSLLCVWSLQDPRRPPSCSLSTTSLTRLKWREF